MADLTRPCHNCMQKEGSNRCGCCRKVFYCSRSCQVENWPQHKPLCQATTEKFQKALKPDAQNCEELLSQIVIKPIETVLKMNPPRHDSDSKYYVDDGDTQISTDRLFTSCVTACAVLAIVGSTKGEKMVLLQHLSIWNAEGSPFERKTRLLKDILPNDFKFISGCIVPGSELDAKLCSIKFKRASMSKRGEPILQELLWENLAGMSWKNQLILLSGLRLGCNIDVSVSDGVNIYNSIKGAAVAKHVAEQYALMDAMGYS